MPVGIFSSWIRTANPTRKPQEKMSIFFAKTKIYVQTKNFPATKLREISRKCKQHFRLTLTPYIKWCFVIALLACKYVIHAEAMLYIFRVRTKVFFFVFLRKFSWKLTFAFSRNICDENTKLSRKFPRKLRDEKALQHLWTIILFLIIHKQKICILYFLLCQNNFEKYSILKGQLHEIFDPWFCSSNNTIQAPDSQAKAFLNSFSNSPRYDRFSNAKIMHAVSMTPHARKFFVR
jgi:hypothetical protein